MATTLVTGANRGIGLQLCRLLVERGDRVLATCRTASDGLRSLAEQYPTLDIHEAVDVTSDQAIAEFASLLGDTPIDILINNAGVVTHEGLATLDIELLRMQFEINAIGPLRVTKALLSNLRAGSQVVMVTSRMGSIGDNDSGGSYGYRMSKAALNMGSVCLARDLAKRDITVSILHPGFVRTDMTGGAGNIDADESAAQLIALIDDMDLERTGTFWHANGQALPW